MLLAAIATSHADAGSSSAAVHSDVVPLPTGPGASKFAEDGDDATPHRDHDQPVGQRLHLRSPFRRGPIATLAELTSASVHWYNTAQLMQRGHRAHEAARDGTDRAASRSVIVHHDSSRLSTSEPRTHPRPEDVCRCPRRHASGSELRRHR